MDAVSNIDIYTSFINKILILCNNNLNISKIWEIYLSCLNKTACFQFVFSNLIILKENFDFV